MINMKRLTVLILIICLLSGSVSFASDTQTADGYDTYYEDVLLGINVLSSEDIVDYEEEITRGMAAHFVTSLTGLGGFSSDVTGKFGDVNAKTEYASDICALADLGIIGGYGDGTFRPDDSISGGEVIKMILSAIGYSVAAQYSGGYPTGYQKYAAQCGLLDGVEFNVNDPIVFADVLKLMYNALDAEVMSEEFISSSNGSYTVNHGKTVASALLKLDSGTGVITATSFATTTYSDKCAKGQVMIDGEIYLEGESGAGRFFGHSVEYYCRKNANGKNVILYACVAKDVRVTTISDKEFEEFTGTDFVYYSNGKVKKAPVSKTTDIVYNNTPAKGIDSSFALDNGSIRLADNDKDGKYDVCLIENYRNVYVQNIDYDNGVIYDKYNKSNPLRIDNSEIGASVLIYDRKGYEIGLEDIEVDYLLSCLISYDGDSMIIYEVVDEVIGVVNGIEQGNDGEIITIGNTGYEVAKELIDSKVEWKIGDKLICYLDKSGRLAAVSDNMSNKYRWAVLESAKKGSGIDPDVAVRLFEESAEEGVLSNYEIADKVSIDSVYIKEGELALLSAEELLEILGGSRKLIRFTLNVDSEINSILTEKGNGFVCLADYSSYTVDYNTKVLGGKIGYNDATLVFSVPDKKLGEENFMVSSLNRQLTHNTSYMLKVFVEDDNTLDADVILIQNTSNAASLTKHSPTIMVDRVSETFDSEGMSRIKISGYEGLGYATYVEAEEAVLSNMKALGDASGNTYSVREGDFIRFELNSNNRIKAAQLVYRGKEDKIYSESNPSASSYYDGTRLLKGIIYQKDGTALRVSVSANPENDIPSQLDLYKVSDYSSVLIYDKNKEVITRGSVYDLLDYQSFGDECSKVILFSVGGELDTLIAVR